MCWFFGLSSASSIILFNHYEYLVSKRSGTLIYKTKTIKYKNKFFFGMCINWTGYSITDMVLFHVFDVFVICELVLVQVT